MNIITTKEQLDEMVAYYLTQDAFAFDVETVGDNRGTPAVNEVSWISFATHGRGDVIPMGHPNGEFLSEVFPLTGQGLKRAEQGLPERELDRSRDKKKGVKTFSEPPTQLFPAEVFKALKPLMFNDSKLTIGHNLVFDLSSVAKYYGGEVPVGPYFDTLMASFLYDNKNKGKLGLDDCLSREFGYSMEKGIGHQVELYSFSDVAKYSYLDSKYTFLLWKTVAPKLTAADVEGVMDLEMDVLKALCSMKLTGAPIDTVQLQVLYDKLTIDIEAARSEVYRIAGQVFNINSNQEKQYILYGPKNEGCRGLRPSKLTGKGKKAAVENLSYLDYSVDAEALEAYKGKDELVGALIAYSELNKLLTTYVTPYLGGEVVKTSNGKTKIEIRESMLVNGRIYGDFVQWGAETGRFSSRNPNLQNIPAPEDPDKVPIEKQNGRAIRNLFIAPEGHKLVVADYSQIEPRVIAALSGDPTMLKNYRDGGDIYVLVGDSMGVNRKAGKVLVLSMAYGIGPDKIAKDIGCSVTEAKKLLNDFAAKFPAITRYKAKVIGLTRNKGYVTTILNRRRYIPDITSKVHSFRSSGERQAFNTRIQGSAADLMKLAMIRAHNSLPEGAKLILTVHDELVTLTPDDKVEATVEAIREAMEGITLLPIPLIADISVVTRWGDAK